MGLGFYKIATTIPLGNTNYLTRNNRSTLVGKRGVVMTFTREKPRGGCARVIMHHELATPTPIGQYKKFNRIQHQFNTKTKQGLLQVFMLQFKDLTS